MEEITFLFFFRFRRNYKGYNEKGLAQMGEQLYCEMRTGGRGFDSSHPFLFRRIYKSYNEGISQNEYA